MYTEKYHLRHPEKAIEDEKEINEVISGTKFMTIAMCRDNEPYIASLNFAYDPVRKSLYFHCSPSGKKVDYLRANPSVWGIIVEDNGYVQGACDHSYRSVQFRGRARFLTGGEEKVEALSLLIDRLDAEPEKMKKRLLVPGRTDKVAVCRIEVDYFTGKRNAPGK
jgi:hypothetical protein